jgi:hypothetical protein
VRFSDPREFRLAVSPLDSREVENLRI